MKTYTEEEVVSAINATAMIANQIGNPESMTAFLLERVPEELHSRILAANLGSRIFSSMSSMLSPDILEKLSSEQNIISERSDRPKDVSDMTNDELNEYIDRKLREKRN